MYVILQVSGIPIDLFGRKIMMTSPIHLFISQLTVRAEAGQHAEAGERNSILSFLWVAGPHYLSKQWVLPGSSQVKSEAKAGNLNHAFRYILFCSLKACCHKAVVGNDVMAEQFLRLVITNKYRSLNKQILLTNIKLKQDKYTSTKSQSKIFVNVLKIHNNDTLLQQVERILF